MVIPSDEDLAQTSSDIEAESDIAPKIGVTNNLQATIIPILVGEMTIVLNGVENICDCNF